MRVRLVPPVCLWLLTFGFLLISSQLSAQTTVAEKDESTKPQPNQAEQSIYIPYNKLREVFEKEGRGVFLPYGEFRKLWDAAHAKPAPVEQVAPVDALISEIDSQATIQQDVLRVQATLTIELMKKGWLQVPLRLGDVALQQATIDDKPARITPAAGGGYQLLIEHADNNPQTLKLKIEYAKAYTKSPGQNRVEIDAPTAPVNRWQITVPQPGVKINVQPYIAATEAVDDKATDNQDNATSDQPDNTNAKDKSVLMALVGAAPKVIIDWTPKSEGASGMTALATAQVTQELFVSETSLRTRAQIRYDISRSTLDKLSIDVPADHKIVNVFDANVRKWDVGDVGRSQRITIELFEPATTQQNVSLELEKIIQLTELSSVAAPLISAVDVGRQQGTLVVHVEPTLRAEVTSRMGLTQLDAAELPPQLTTQAWTFAYRYAALPFELYLGLIKVQPRISVNQLVSTSIQPDLMAIDTLLIYDIAEAGIFQLEFDLPTGFTVREVTGTAYADAAPAQVDSHHVDTSKPDHLIVNLSKKAIGKTCLQLRLEQKLSDANLLSPTGTPANLPLVIPKVSQEFINRVTGQLLLLSPESLRLNPQATSGLRPVSLSQITSDPNAQLTDARFPNRRLTSALAFSDQPIAGTLQVERRKPLITTKQRLLAQVDSGVVRYQAQFLYDIQYSGVDSLRIDVPQALANEIANETTNINETAITPAPADVDAGYVAWRLTGPSELIGRQVITFSWEQTLAELPIGQSLEIDLPYLKPRQVDRAWGQVVVTKAEALDVQPSGQLTGIRPIDPHHDVMPEAAVPNAARAFEFHDDWKLKLSVTRYKLEEIKHTSIERALIRSVLTRSGQVAVQALYRLRSAHQRLTIQLPEGTEFDAQPARINGNPVSLERGDKAELYIPLSGIEPDQSVLLELRYSLPEHNGLIDIPHFPENPAAQQVFVNVFVPKERGLIGWSGDWTQTWTWQGTDLLSWTPVHERTDDQLEVWVKEGLATSASPPFQRDGTLYSFSTLKPQPPPKGSLRLVTANSRVLTGAVLSLLAIVALVLLRQPLKLKIVVIISVLLICILIGVFAPSLASQLMSMPIAIGMTVVILVWLGAYGYWAADAWTRSPRKVKHHDSETQPESSTAPSNATSEEPPTFEDSAEGGERHE